MSENASLRKIADRFEGSDLSSAWAPLFLQVGLSAFGVINPIWLTLNHFVALFFVLS